MFDKANGNTLWSNSIAKEMTNVKVAFKILDDDESVLRNHQFVKYHMIFDVKMDNFRQNVRLVAGGHMTDALVEVTYASVVSSEIVLIAFTITALNHLQVKCGNSLNAYINAPVMVLIWTTLGTKFGNSQGKTEIFVRDLYSLKSSGAALRKHLG